MANALFDKGREGFLDGSIDWDTDAINVMLLTSNYVVSLTAHSLVSDLGVANTIFSSVVLGAKTVTAGVADAGNLTCSSVTGSIVNTMVIAQATGTSTSDRIIAYIDTATGLPVTPNGGDITVTWDDGANKIFKL